MTREKAGLTARFVRHTLTENDRAVVHSALAACGFDDGLACARRLRRESRSRHVPLLPVTDGAVLRNIRPIACRNPGGAEADRAGRQESGPAERVGFPFSAAPDD
jgi:hypothetical protein